MSLSINDPRSRGRSKSPGGRERSRSREVRQPSPPQAVVSKKTKKYYESDSTESSESEVESERDRRARKNREDNRYEDPRYEDSKYRRASSPGADTRESARGGKYAPASDRYREPEYKDPRHPSNVDPARYSYARPEATRNASYSQQSDHGRPSIPSDRREYAVPGSFEDDDDRRDNREKSSRSAPAGALSYGQEGTRHLSLDTGRGQAPPSQYTQYGAVRPDQYTATPLSPNSERTPHGYFASPTSARPEDYGPKMVTSGRGMYAVPEKYQYAKAPEQISYVSKSDSHRRASYVQTARPQLELDLEVEVEKRPLHRESRQEESRLSRVDSRHDDRRPHVETHYDDRRLSRVESSHDDRRPSRSGPSDAQVIEIKPGASKYAPPPQDLEPRMHRLSVTGGTSGSLSLIAPGHSHGYSGGLPPGSPLLEAYRGTYQSISPMPSPLAIGSRMDDDDLSDLEPLEPVYSSDESERRRPKKTVLKKRVSIYDPEPHALALAAVLKHTKPEPEPLIAILPRLSDDNMMALRAEYKKHIKVQGKGINIAKHIKLKVPGNLGKIAYATALGRWESEAHWANFWYQSGSSRRELLIESLMGRTNVEIRQIKAAFSDKRYNDSLEKCMQTELKKDKFRNAVLLALEETRMDELAPLSKTRIRDDVEKLYKALVAKEGGETAMIEIIVVRSDSHLREVLREFEIRYKRNFAREMIQKSRNLVGETLAHILNGVLNRPVRDALLLHQALAETSKDRTELLISRLVRFHWEPRHLDRVKIEYKRKYNNRLERDIEDGTKGDFGEFCLALCDTEP